jgi:hypothetical protein
MLEAGGSHKLISLRIELACERNTWDLKPFWHGCIIHFLKNTLFRQNVETHVSYGTIKSMLVAGVPCTLFHYDNWVILWEGYCLPSVFKCEEHHLCAK